MPAGWDGSSTAARSDSASGPFQDRHPRRVDRLGAEEVPAARDIDLMLKWRGPMEELPRNLGWNRPIFEHYPVDIV